MTSRKMSLRAIAALCDEIGPEDGVDPRRVRHRKRNTKKDRKAEQVSRQAEVAVRLTLGALFDDALEGVRVVRVEPAPDSRRLRVVLEQTTSPPEMTAREVAQVVERVDRILRMEVASALHRKRAPSLTFAFVGMREEEQDEE
jgi:ribosome-binding factor A